MVAGGMAAIGPPLGGAYRGWAYRGWGGYGWGGAALAITESTSALAITDAAATRRDMAGIPATTATVISRWELRL